MIFKPGGNISFGEDESCVLDVALGNGIAIDHSCGGMGSCGTCQILVESPLCDLSERTEVEAEMALDRGFGPDERLACQLQPIHGLVVRIPLKKKPIP